jgi:hypothetical protein
VEVDLGVVVEFVAGVSTRLCIGCGGEYPHDDDCEFNWILRWIRWDCGLIKGDPWELLWYCFLASAISVIMLELT